LGIVYRLIVLGFACAIAIWLRRSRRLEWSTAFLLGVLAAIGLFVIGEVVRP
jgi:hypothetical protein